MAAGRRVVALVAVAVFLSPTVAADGTAFPSASLGGGPPFESIFAFGDAFTDTGNNPVVWSWYNVSDEVMRPPYGMTYFGGVPTGRNSNGRLIIDFIAQGLGLPLVPAYQSHQGSFRQGASFAVADATALNASFFDSRQTDISLEMQLGWFEELKPSLCKTDQECKDFFGRSLFFMGEVGIDDYHTSFGMRKSMQEIRAFIPDVIRTISMGTERVIQHGAKTVVVPGMIPSGCLPSILVASAANADTPMEYDATTGCLKEPNEIVALHNSLLQDAVEKLQEKHPDLTIMYTDMFNNVMEMVKSPEKFGFKSDVHTVCCGGRGRYHYNMSVICGDEAATTCKDPSTRLFWDGVHLTEAAYYYIAKEWLNTIVSSLAARASS
ncbi:unnamed protein product [Urochloa decumbens]|uniref:GDSL esterase/lipase n=1 Tax=Urochloa decumbens TaxID=240449 RepID=A0ABC8VUG1_9POAL